MIFGPERTKIRSVFRGSRKNMKESWIDKCWSNLSSSKLFSAVVERWSCAHTTNLGDNVDFFCLIWDLWLVNVPFRIVTFSNFLESDFTVSCKRLDRKLSNGMLLTRADMFNCKPISKCARSERIFAKTRYNMSKQFKFLQLEMLWELSKK